MPKGHSDLAPSTAQRTTIPNVPFRTPMFGADGNMTRTWILFFEQLGGAFTQILNGGGAGLWGGVNIQVSSYAAQATDDGLLIVFATTAAATFQLPSKPPSTVWKVFVQNAGTAAVTLLPNGAPLLDGAVPGGALQPGQGVYISTDGTNYYTERGTAVSGGGSAGGENLQSSDYAATAADNGKLISFTAPATLLLPATPPSATWCIFTEQIGAGVLSVVTELNNYPAGWIPRVIGANWGGIVTFDEKAPTAGSYNVTVSKIGTQNLFAVLTALKTTGTWAYVQGRYAATATDAVSISSFAAAFTEPNTAGNCLVVDMYFTTGSLGTSVVVTDSLGNTYTQAGGAHLAGGGGEYATFVAPNCAAGTGNIVTITTASSMSNALVALHEYSGIVLTSPADTSDTAGDYSSPAPSPLTLSVTTSGANELLHLFFAVWTYNGPTGPFIDELLVSLPLRQNQGVYITTDGTNYFTERGLVPLLETNGTPNATQGLLNLVAGANVTLTDDGAGDITIAATGGGGTGSGGVNLQTASYTAVAGDSGLLISFSSSSATALTLTLPATPPSATWNVFVENAGIYSSPNPGELTILSASVSIDAESVPSSLVLCVGQGVYITTDGTNYFTERGGPIPGTLIAGNTTGSVAVLSITKSDIGGGACLLCESNDPESTVVGISAVNRSGGAFTGTALAVVGAYGNGITSNVTAGTYGGVAVTAQNGNGVALAATNVGATYPTANFANTYSGGINQGSLQLTGHLAFYPGVTFANLGNERSNNGAFCYCTDAKNILDDLALPGSVAVGGGHGSMVAYINLTWRIMC